MQHYYRGNDISEQTLYSVLLIPTAMSATGPPSPNTADGYDQIHAFCQSHTESKELGATT